MEKFTESFIHVVGVILGIVLLASLLALPVMWLWNWLMPDIFGLTEINFLQALGINAMSSALFKSSNSSTK